MDVGRHVMDEVAAYSLGIPYPGLLLMAIVVTYYVAQWKMAAASCRG
jgi:hypothetical protein